MPLRPPAARSRRPPIGEQPDHRIGQATGRHPSRLRGSGTGRTPPLPAALRHTPSRSSRAPAALLRASAPAAPAARPLVPSALSPLPGTKKRRAAGSLYPWYTPGRPSLVITRHPARPRGGSGPNLFAPQPVRPPVRTASSSPPPPHARLPVRGAAHAASEGQKKVGPGNPDPTRRQPLCKAVNYFTSSNSTSSGWPLLAPPCAPALP